MSKPKSEEVYIKTLLEKGLRCPTLETYRLSVDYEFDEMEKCDKAKNESRLPSVKSPQSPRKNDSRSVKSPTPRSNRDPIFDRDREEQRHNYAAPRLPFAQYSKPRKKTTSSPGRPRSSPGKPRFIWGGKRRRTIRKKKNSLKKI